MRARRSNLSRSLWAASLALLLTWSRVGDAQSVAVPVAVQANLMAKVASYDRNFVSHAGDKARIFVVVKSGNSDSVRAANQMESALEDIPRIANLPHEEQVVEFTDPAGLASRCKAGKATIVYVSPGLDHEIEAIRAALTDSNILTVGAMPDYVKSGLVLGFGLQDGRTKLLFNLPEARRQNVAVLPEAIRLMTVYE